MDMIAIQQAVNHPKQIYQKPVFEEHELIEQSPNDDLKAVVESLLKGLYVPNAYEVQQGIPKTYRPKGRTCKKKPQSYYPSRRLDSNVNAYHYDNYHKNPINNPIQYPPRSYYNGPIYEEEEDSYYDDEYDEYYDSRRPYRRYHRHAKYSMPLKNLGVKVVN